MGVKKIPSFHPPIITPFASRNIHYRRIFGVIFDWYALGDVTFNDSELFNGLRHLTKIYEFCCLIMIIDSLSSIGFEIRSQEWRNYKEKPFGGKPSKRPINLPNNFFTLRKDKTLVTLHYEPNIWRMKNARNGDPVAVLSANESNVNSYISPDFFIEIKNIDSKSVDFLIFDSRYSPSSSVENYSLTELIHKYFFGIHYVNENGQLGRSPTQAVWALYPKRGKKIVDSEYYSSEHSLSGSMPLLPSLGGINLRPSKLSVFQNKLALLIGKLT
ncbi:hypothetical protein SAMN03084138_03092 [Enterovibrio norvegicus DSM 15893]|uniref:Uncharacterized protein n=2 Tax=Enterovibrio norvegicus TaxID=188144 RepID=A0A1I5T4N2_9GAMM|nr:hypothetical protein SAMN03084138_03092 [Enterovibrio norvegicus DSM 15893]